MCGRFFLAHPTYKTLMWVAEWVIFQLPWSLCLYTYDIPCLCVTSHPDLVAMETKWQSELINTAPQDGSSVAMETKWQSELINTAPQDGSKSEVALAWLLWLPRCSGVARGCDGHVLVVIRLLKSDLLASRWDVSYFFFCFISLSADVICWLSAVAVFTLCCYTCALQYNTAIESCR